MLDLRVLKEQIGITASDIYAASLKKKEEEERVWTFWFKKLKRTVAYSRKVVLVSQNNQQTSLLSSTEEYCSQQGPQYRLHISGSQPGGQGGMIIDSLLFSNIIFYQPIVY